MAQRIDYFFGSTSGGSYQGFTVDYGGQPSSTLALSAGTLSFSRADGVNFSVYTTVDLGNLLPAATPGFANGTVTTTDGHIGAVVAGVAGVPADNHGSLTLSSTSSSGIVWSGGHAAYAGLAASGSQGATTTASVSSIASMDVLTSASATAALATIDGALASVNASRAALGAMQNSFTSVVASLQAAAQNLTASLSRTQDADFAAETAQWSRAQILQHAALAMVAQANAGPRVALLLLR
jgi:flagellin